MTKVIRDSESNVINIGDWDDKGGLNPMPDGATEKDETVITGGDGSLIAEEDYRKARKSEYPAIGDQLDYIYEHGLDAWKSDMIKPVKDKYPKG